MSLSIASLNSGSNGNCYYLSNGQEAVLVDAGLSCRETELRMRRLGLFMDRVKAIFISHEHDDHIRGAEVLSRRYQLPVYITEATRLNGRFSLDDHLVRPFGKQEAVSIGDLEITAFPKSHDAADPYSFIVASHGVRVGVFTDIGDVCDNLIRHFMQCHAAFLETNYDEQMLEEGRYPRALKNRIRGGQGHLSNRQALELFTAYRPAFMSHLLLSHLSQDNNRPELVEAIFNEASGGTEIIVASRYGESRVFTVEGDYIGKAGLHWNADGNVSVRPSPGAIPAKPKIAAPSKSRKRATSRKPSAAKGNASSVQGTLFNDGAC